MPWDYCSSSYRLRNAPSLAHCHPPTMWLSLGFACWKLWSQSPHFPPHSAPALGCAHWEHVPISAAACDPPLPGQQPSRLQAELRPSRGPCARESSFSPSGNRTPAGLTWGWGGIQSTCKDRWARWGGRTETSSVIGLRARLVRTPPASGGRQGAVRLSRCYHNAVISEIKHTVSVIHFSRPETTPFSWSTEKLSSMKLIPGAKKVGDHWSGGGQSWILESVWLSNDKTGRNAPSFP